LYIVLAFSAILVIAVFYAYFYLNGQKESRNLLQLSSHHEYDLSKSSLKISSLISYSKRNKYYRPKVTVNKIINALKNYFKSTDAQTMQQLQLSGLLNQNRYYIKGVLTSLLSFEESYKIPYDNNSNMPAINKYCMEFVDACNANITEEKIKKFFSAESRSHSFSHLEITLIVPMIKLELITILKEITDVSYDILKQFDEAEKFVKELMGIPQGSVLIDDLIEKNIKNSDNEFRVHVYKILMHENFSHDELVSNFKDACYRLSFDIEVAAQSYFVTISEYTVLTNSIIDSLKNIERIDQIKMQKIISPLEKILLMDPDDKYSKMTDYSKAAYRKRVEHLSKKLNTTEIDVSQTALQLAKKHNEHIGRFFYHREYIKQLFDEFNKRPPISNNTKLIFYNMFNTVMTLLLSTGIFAAGYFLYDNILSLILSVLLLPFFYSISDSITQKLINRFITSLNVCQMDYKGSVPYSSKTIVLATTLILRRGQIDEILSNLETMYYSNKNDNINFGILADFPKSEIETTQSDQDLYDYMQEAINRLNKKVKQTKFYFFVRKKIYNANYDAFIADELFLVK
jgi:cyclic beta-1,2-glucan synthetase